MMKIYSLLIILCTAMTSVIGQERFAKIYDDEEWLASLITNVIPTDNGYFCGGLFVDANLRRDGFFIWYVDQFGNLIDSNTLIDSNRHIDMFHSNLIIDNVDDSYQLIGYQVDANGQNVLHLKWRENEWPPEEKVFNGLDINGENNQSSDFFSHGPYLYISSTLDGYDGRTDVETYLFKYDTIRDTVIWERNIGDGRWREIRSELHPISDSTFLLGFNRNDHHQTNNHFDYRMAIWKMDTSGQVLDQYELDIPDRLPGWPTDMITTPDGGFIITGNMKTEINFDAGRIAGDGYVFKLDENLNFIWDAEIKGDTLGVLSSCRRIIELIDNSYLISGNLVDWVPEMNIPTEQISILCNININGEINWKRYFHFIDEPDDAQEIHFNYDMRQTPDGGFILSGSFQDFKDGNNGKQRGYLIKVDSDGCLIPNCGINSTSDTQKDKTQIQVYPNPAFDFLAFQIISEDVGSWQGQIVDATGRVIKQLKSLRPDIQHLVAVDTWVKGIYFLELINGAGEKAVNKFVID